MITNLRLSKAEQEALRAKSIQLNKKLINNDKMPLTESDLAHIILKKGISKAMLNSEHVLVWDS
jgi:hypothetical protein